ncbi:MAG: VCBS repeat-containing protein, partial [Armatimonadetes bacterium]|nr:VCBS repeat-containing protein [Armatimonadota bacterium]
MPTTSRFSPKSRALRFFLIPGALLSFAATCAGEAQPAAVFTDRTADLGLQLSTDAACWADFDNDGWVDLCASGVVWKNNAGKGFTKLADAGASVAADFDNDGFVDLFCWSSLRLYRNDAGKGFAEVKLPELP